MESKEELWQVTNSLDMCRKDLGLAKLSQVPIRIPCTGDRIRFWANSNPHTSIPRFDASKHNVKTAIGETTTLCRVAFLHKVDSHQEAEATRTAYSDKGR